MRELAQCLGNLQQPQPFVSDFMPTDLKITTMTSYKSDFPFKNVFEQQTMDNVLAEWFLKFIL
jgi:2,3-bisphosphoglycerate-independent phosphoglycerate mutase